MFPKIFIIFISAHEDEEHFYSSYLKRETPMLPIFLNDREIPFTKPITIEKLRKVQFEKNETLNDYAVFVNARDRGLTVTQAIRNLQERRMKVKVHKPFIDLDGLTETDLE